jgi:TPP-dependent indolepyruvate ferredoxin oxidoreductase alpha subunit
MDAVQRELREIEGCSVLIYDQTCAAEKRRRRKKANSPTRISVCLSTTPYVKAVVIAACNPTVPR